MPKMPWKLSPLRKRLWDNFFRGSLYKDSTPLFFQGLIPIHFPNHFENINNQI